MDTESVIVAVASPPGRSVRGIVRLSGPGAFDAVNATVGDDTRPSLSVSRSRHTVRLALGPPPLAIPVLALTFPGPHSYTGEDTVELLMPGNPVLLDRAVDALIAAGRAVDIGVRRAEPGEFTARAYFHGRLSLTEAEGVAATIAAQSDAALRAAQMLTTGRLGTFAHTLADDLAASLALVEAGIDFTDEEDVVAITPADLLVRLADLRNRIDEQLNRSVGLESLDDLPWVVLVGPPNAGKSTLFNALLGRDRAVVSATAGTTRDVIVEPLSVSTAHGDAEVMLVDLAGLDDADVSQVNAQMQQAAQRAMQRAELIIHCAPTSIDPPPARMTSTRAVPTVTVHTKCDLRTDTRPTSTRAALDVSGVTGAGLDDLRHAIAGHLADRAISIAADTIALKPRHEAALGDARSAIDDAAAIVTAHSAHSALADAELIAAAMRAALDALAELAGDITPDDVLGRIFSTFCIGK